MISRPNAVVLFCEIHPTSTQIEHITETQYLIAKFGCVSSKERLNWRKIAFQLVLLVEIKLIMKRKSSNNIVIVKDKR